jgi:hypothetical protein
MKKFIYITILFIVFILPHQKVLSAPQEDCTDCEPATVETATITIPPTLGIQCNLYVEIEKRKCGENSPIRIKILKITPENDACIENLTAEDVLSVVWYSLIVDNPLNLPLGTWIIKWASCWKKDTEGGSQAHDIKPCPSEFNSCCYTVVKVTNTTNCQGVLGKDIISDFSGTANCVLDGCVYTCHNWINFHSKNFKVK